MKILGLIAGAALLFGAQSAYAVTITNGSFEVGANPGSFTTKAAGSTDITGWTVDSGSVDYIGTYWPADTGSRSVDLSGNVPGSISQTLALVDGQQYKLSFSIRGNGDGGVDPQGVLVSLGGITSEFFAPQNAVVWALQTFVFTYDASLAGSNVLQFAADAVNGAFGPGLDSVTIAATPIPGAILLFGSALGGMGFLGYRRKKLEVAA
jgi:choice-of-anchor C domain-containing protein